MRRSKDARQTPRPIVLFARLQAAAFGAMGILLLVGIANDLPTVLLGGLCILWTTSAAWYCGTRLALVYGGIGLAVVAWQEWPWETSHFIEAVGLMLLALCGVVWIGRLRRLLDYEYRRARIDSLTGLPNRQAFFERCEAELSRARRFQRPLTLILLDGDRFKEVNDRHGHAIGDQALAATAQTLQHATRQYDLVARLGGDEFAVLLPESNPADAEKVALRLQTALAAEVAPEYSPLTFSFGVATFYPGNWESAACLMHADRLLYSSKQAGRGQICAETLVETSSTGHQ